MVTTEPQQRGARLARCLAAATLFGALSVVAGTAPQASAAPVVSPGCNAVNDPVHDGLNNGDLIGPLQFLAGEVIAVSVGFPTSEGTPTLSQLAHAPGPSIPSQWSEINGGFPASLSWKVAADGSYWVMWGTDPPGATWTVSCTAAPDADSDGVDDADDMCVDTALPDQPTKGLKPNHFAANAAGEFVDRNGRPSGITIEDTGGCSAAQIIVATGLGNGHTKHGLSKGQLMAWANQ